MSVAVKKQKKPNLRFHQNIFFDRTILYLYMRVLTNVLNSERNELQ